MLPLIRTEIKTSYNDYDISNQRFQFCWWGQLKTEIECLRHNPFVFDRRSLCNPDSTHMANKKAAMDQNMYDVSACM